jgi:flavodoxin
MNIRLIYFSQTGNTRKVANAMAAVFNGKNHSANTISYNKDEQRRFYRTGYDWSGRSMF